MAKKNVPFNRFKLQDAYHWALFLAEGEEESVLGDEKTTMAEANKNAIVHAKEAGYAGKLFTKETRKVRGKKLAEALWAFGKEHNVDANTSEPFDANGLLWHEPGYDVTTAKAR